VNGITRTFWTDTRHATRSLRRSPGFTLAAVLTLALGIGVVVGVFSVINTVLLRPLPYPRPDRIVTVWTSWEGTPRGRVPAPEYLDYRRVSAFDALGVLATGPAAVDFGAGDVQRLRAAFVTFDLLRALGTAPAFGSGFVEADQTPGGGQRVLLTDETWPSEFGASRQVIGRRLNIDGIPHVVAGIMPPRFRLPDDLGTAARTCRDATMNAITVFLLTAAAVATWLPTRRAIKANPSAALREG
jgi:putative ABC transport system permease protein